MSKHEEQERDVEIAPSFDKETQDYIKHLEQENAKLKESKGTQVEEVQPVYEDDKTIEETKQPTTGIQSLDNVVAGDPNAKIIEIEDSKVPHLVVKRTPHSQWAKNFSNILGGEDGGIKDLGAACDFVFSHMVVRPKVDADDFENFMSVVEVVSEAISFQMGSSGN